LNEETSRYIFRILAIKEIYNHPEDYGFYLSEEQLYPEESVDIVEVTETIPDLASYALERGINYKILKRHNPWLRNNTLTIKSTGKSYFLKIPAGKMKEKGIVTEQDSSVLDQH